MTRQWNIGAKPGEKHWNARLTAAQVLEIRTWYRAKFTQQDIADAYGISSRHVSDIVLRKRWAHVR